MGKKGREVKWRREMLGNFWDKRMNIEYNYVIFCMCVFVCGHHGVYNYV